VAHEIRAHGELRVDDYAWLRTRHWPQMLADSSRLEPEIRAHLEAENAYTAARMEDTRALQQKLYEELMGAIEEEQQSVPDQDGAYEYYTSYRSGQQHPIYNRRRIADQSEEILLDVNRLTAGHDYFQVSSFSHSPNHRYVAYCADCIGAESHTLYLHDTRSEAPPLALAENVYGDLCWSADSRYIFYVALNAMQRPDSVFCYCIDDAPAHSTRQSAQQFVGQGESMDEGQGEKVYLEKDAGFFVNLYRTRSGRYIVIHCYDHATSEDWVIRRDAPHQLPMLIRARETNTQYDTHDCRGKWVIYNNSAGAENFKLSVADYEAPTVWRDIYLPDPGAMLKEVLVYNDHIACLEIKDASSRIVVLPATIVDTTTQLEPRAVAFDEPCYQARLINTFAYQGDILRVEYSSLKTPRRIYDYDMRLLRRRLRKEQRIPSGYNAQHYTTQRLWAAAADGADIPISVVFHKDTPLDGSAPLLLYAYGAYGHSTPAAFALHRLPLLRRGFVYAIAHIRGGSEKGYGWYKAAKFTRKKNTFDDFIRCAEHLINAKFSYRGGIAIHGASAGGMTIGSALNSHPALFAAALAEVPFVDVLNTMCDPSLPLTPPEWREWGNPITDAALYRYMRSYSPYDQVRAQPYPDMLVTAGLSDPRVGYWEPAKWVAKLRAQKNDHESDHKNDDSDLLLRVDMSEGHAGAAGRFDNLREIAFKYAFLLKTFGQKE